ncbi:hypothetical protein [Burkholderia sp. BCC0044]|nr:hypothetical protein [Burkholderia sp. BCC0044]
MSPGLRLRSFAIHDAARWNITKLGGASGRPAGLEALEPLD